MRYVHVRIKPQPQCPDHKEPMRLIVPKPEDTWLPFWSCPRWRRSGPSCDHKEQATLKDPEQLMFWDNPSDWKEVRVYD